MTQTMYLCFGSIKITNSQFVFAICDLGICVLGMLHYFVSFIKERARASFREQSSSFGRGSARKKSLLLSYPLPNQAIKELGFIF